MSLQQSLMHEHKDVFNGKVGAHYSLEVCGVRLPDGKEIIVLNGYWSILDMPACDDSVDFSVAYDPASHRLGTFILPANLCIVPGSK